MIGTGRCYVGMKQAGCGRYAYDRALVSSDQPQTWHYGLVARYWAEKRHDAAEAEFLKAYIEAGQPALDVGCGTGRVLIPLLHAGLDVDGVDISPDMLAYARARAEREGFTPNLHAQAMHELDLPRTFRTIYSCGWVGIGGPDSRIGRLLRESTITSTLAAFSSSTTRCRTPIRRDGATGRRTVERSCPRTSTRAGGPETSKEMSTGSARASSTSTLSSSGSRWRCKGPRDA